MTLRDWFASKAIHTAFCDLVRDEDAECGRLVGDIRLTPGHEVFTSADYIARVAYEIADAMLAERQRVIRKENQ